MRMRTISAIMNFSHAIPLQKLSSAPLDWQYTEFPLSASDAVLCTYYACVGASNQTNK